MAVKTNTKPADQLVREGVKRVTDDDLRWLAVKLRERVSDALGLIDDRYHELNRVLSAAQDSAVLFQTVDIIDRCVQEEAKRRFRKD